MRVILGFSASLCYAVFFSGFATAAMIPQSSCSFNNMGGTGKLGGFTCNLYPSDSAGNLNDINTGIMFPGGYDPNADPLTPGYVVIVDPGLNPNDPFVQTNQADWLQVVQFAPGTGGLQFQATSINLYTLGCNNSANPNDFSCFPTYATVKSGANYFDAEPMSTPAYSTPYLYTADDLKDHRYSVYFVGETAGQTVPEPGSIGLLVLGVGGLAVLKRHRTINKSQADLA